MYRPNTTSKTHTGHPWTQTLFFPLSLVSFFLVFDFTVYNRPHNPEPCSLHAAALLTPSSCGSELASIPTHSPAPRPAAPHPPTGPASTGTFA
eukprot:2977468-Rhodomonas_salina.1